MTETFAYIPLPETEDKAVPHTNERFRRLVHVNANRAPRPALGRHEERALIQSAQKDNDVAAIDTLVAQHAGYISKIARSIATFNNVDAMIEDLISEGVEAFIVAIGRYNLDRQEVRLNSFAAYHVSGAVLSYVLKNRHAFAVGTSSGERVFLLHYGDHLARFRNSMGHTFQPTARRDLAEMSRMTGASTRAIRRVCALRGAGPTLSTDSLVIIDNSAKTLPERALMYKQQAEILAEVVDRVLAKLKPRDRSIAAELLDDAPGAADRRSDLAKRHGLSAERIGQIHRSALDTIRKALVARGITGANA